MFGKTLYVIYYVLHVMFYVLCSTVYTLYCIMCFLLCIVLHLSYIILYYVAVLCMALYSILSQYGMSYYIIYCINFIQNILYHIPYMYYILLCCIGFEGWSCNFQGLTSLWSSGREPFGFRSVARTVSQGLLCWMSERGFNFISGTFNAIEAVMEVTLIVLK